MRQVRFDMGRAVILNLGGFGFLREYFKLYRPSPQKKVHTVEVTFAAKHVQKSKLETKFCLKNPELIYDIWYKWF